MWLWAEYKQTLFPLWRYLVSTRKKNLLTFTKHIREIAEVSAFDMCVLQRSWLNRALQLHEDETFTTFVDINRGRMSYVVFLQGLNSSRDTFSQMSLRFLTRDCTQVSQNPPKCRSLEKRYSTSDFLKIEVLWQFIRELSVSATTEVCLRLDFFNYYLEKETSYFYDILFSKKVKT